ncbi:MAG TPA: amidohydrolase family protein, partial [Kangiella sp.]
LYLESKSLDYIPPLIKAINEPGIHHIMAEKNPQSWRSKADYLGFMAKKLFDAKLPMILGSDAGANYTINGLGAIAEMQLLESYGISPEDILTSATHTPAQAFGLQSSGTVAVGYKANLVITQGDPRNDLSEFMALQGLIKDGVYFDGAAIKQMKTEAKNHMSSYQFLGWYLINWWQQNFS